MTCMAPVLEEIQSGPRSPLHVLTLTPLYPTADDDAQGCFVAEPLAATEIYGIKNTVMVADPFHRSLLGRPALPSGARRKTFFSIPGNIGLASSGYCLFAGVTSTVSSLHHRCRIDVIHAHAALPCGHAARLLSRQLAIPFVVTVHGLDAFSKRQVRGYAGQWCARVSKSVYEAARRVICVSERVREQVLQETSRARTAVIYNSVDPETFRDNVDRGAILLSVGDLIPTKSHDLTLKAFAAIASRHPGALLEIIGDGPERCRLESLATNLGIGGRVRFFGRQSRSQVADAMRRCTIFVLPSHYEGLGCVYLEAMSCAKPVIGCRRQGIEEIIRDGANGCLVSPGDLPGLTEAVDRLLGDRNLRLQLGSEARKKIIGDFTLEHQARRLIEIYKECTA
jgi:teichuronic acid biosynthesis glycosyltransferase TuaC